METLGFSVCGFGHFLDRFFGLCAKRLRLFDFGFADFSFFKHPVFGFRRNSSGFSVLLSNVVFGFSYFVLFGFQFLFDLTGNDLYLQSWTKLLRKFWFWTYSNHNYDKLALVFVQKCPPYPP